MALYKIFKETSLPGTLEPNSIYFIAPASKPDYVEIYVTGTSGSVVKRVINSDDVQAMIDSASTGLSQIEIVADISARDALNPTTTVQALVLDASDDPTVDSGAATYIYNPSTEEWIKIAEYESMDMVIDWSYIQNRPSSSVSDIDDAVAKKHTHANKTELDKISEDGSGYLLYNGDYPKIAWDSVNW